MFTKFYGLNEQPFGVTPDPKYLYLGSSHREALASLYYGIQSNCGFIAMVADPGMGKTTLLFQLLERLETTRFRTAFLFQTQCSQREFLRYLLAELSCGYGEQDVVTLNARLNKALIQLALEGRRLVLLIDEAQNLDNSVLEAIRLLSDFETPNQKLMQIVLVGQPPLADKLSSPELIQLRQRISIIARLEALNPSEVHEYIEWRLKASGHETGDIFTPDAIALIARHSEGIPRTINNLCFNALTIGYAERKKKIDSTVIQEVISDLRLKESPAPTASTAKKKDRKWFHLAAGVGLTVMLGSAAFSLMQMPRHTPEQTPTRAVQPAVAAPSPEVLPPAATVPPEQPKFLAITVQQGETLNTISERYLGRKLDKTLVDNILRINPQLANQDLIKVGEHIRIPMEASEPGAGPSPIDRSMP